MWFSEDMQASFESSFPRYLASCLLSIDETDLSKLLKKIGWMPLIKPFFLCTAKRILERRGIQTSSSFVKIGLCYE